MILEGEEYLQIKEACHIITSTIFTPKKEYIYLPTQEQLQEMVKTPHVWRLGGLLENIYNFSENKYSYEELPKNYVFENFNDMNELWLAFVMYEKYSKVWTGEKWMKAE